MPTTRPDHILAGWAIRRWPRLAAHVIAESRGYCNVTLAGSILASVANGDTNNCEWIREEFASNPKPAVRLAIKERHKHKDPARDYAFAKGEVLREGAGEPAPGEKKEWV